MCRDAKIQQSIDYSKNYKKFKYRGRNMLRNEVREWPLCLSCSLHAPWMTSFKPITSTTTFRLRTPRSLSPDQIFSWVSDPFWFAFWVLPQALQTQYDQNPNQCCLQQICSVLPVISDFSKWNSLLHSYPNRNSDVSLNFFLTTTMQSV